MSVSDLSGPLDHFVVSPDGARLAGGPCSLVDDRITITDLDGGDDTLVVATGRN